MNMLTIHSDSFFFISLLDKLKSKIVGLHSKCMVPCFIIIIIITIIVNLVKQNFHNNGLDERVK